MNDLEKYVSDDGYYVIPVTWESYGTVQISGVKNLKEAYEVAKKYIDDLPLPDDGEYIDDSFKINIDEERELLDAQIYYRHNAYFHNPENKEE